MTSKQVTIKSSTGIHAKPAAIFVKTANKFPCDIIIEKENVKINGKSIMGIMMLSLTRGSQVLLSAQGDREEEAVEELSGLMESDFAANDLR